MGTLDEWEKTKAERTKKGQETELGQKETRPEKKEEMDATPSWSLEIRRIQG